MNTPCDYVVLLMSELCMCFLVGNVIQDRTQVFNPKVLMHESCVLDFFSFMAFCGKFLIKQQY